MVPIGPQSGPISPRQDPAKKVATRCRGSLHGAIVPTHRAITGNWRYERTRQCTAASRAVQISGHRVWRNAAMNSTSASRGTNSGVSRFSTQRFGRPSKTSKMTSEGSPRIFVVAGATRILGRRLTASGRVRTSAGQRPAFSKSVHQSSAQPGTGFTTGRGRPGPVTVPLRRATHRAIPNRRAGGHANWSGSPAA